MPVIGTSDYINTACSSTSPPAHTGTGYTGIRIYNQTTSGPGFVEGNYREYINENLANPVQSGQTYRISMWVKRNAGFVFAVADMQLALTNGYLTQTAYNPIVNPPGQIVTFTNSPITSLVWTQLTATITANATYSTITLGNFNPLGASTYTGTATNVNTADAYYYIDDVSIEAIPTLTVTPGNMTICAGTPTTFTASLSNNLGVISNASYTYQPTPNDPSLTYVTADHSQATVSPVVNTTYSVTGQDPGTGCKTGTTVTIGVVQTPTPTVTPTNTTICSGANTTLSASGAYGYTWSPGGANTPAINVSPTSTTVYTLSAANASYCPQVNVTATVNVIPPVGLTVSSTSHSICPGQNLVITASGASSYTWSPGGQTTSSITVSPASNTTYSVSAANGSCPPVSGTWSVTLFPPPQNLSASANTTICAGNSTNLSASISNTVSSNYSFMWQPGSIPGAAITVTPASTTIYTVTVSDNIGCNTSVSKTVTVTVVGPGSGINVSSNPICAGQSTTLTASGVSTYTWLPSGPFTSSIVVTPSVTTSYTVSGQNPACGQITTAVVTVTVLSNSTVPAPVITGNLAVCMNTVSPSTATTVLTATVPGGGNFIYTWTPGPLTGQSIVITPTNNTNYQCTVTHSLGCGISKSSTVPVTVMYSECCYLATAMPATVTAGNRDVISGGGIYSITGTVTVAANANWSNCTFRMASGARILVQPGYVLRLTNVRMYACEGLWEGIVLQQNGSSSGRAEINTSTIEDAYRVVSYVGNGTPIAGDITISNTTLNKNYTGVYIEGSQASYGPGSGYPYTGTNVVFSSAPSLYSPGSNLKVSSFYTPVIKARGRSGVELKNVSLAQVGFSTAAPFPSSPDNTFDNLDYGVVSDNSGLRTYNNLFQNLVSGTGINAFGASVPNTASLISTKDRFTEVYNAITTGTLNSAEVYSITVNNSTTSGTIGNYGVNANSTYATFRTKYSTFTNCSIGVYAAYGAQTYSTSPIMTVSNNTIAPSGSGIVATGVYVSASGITYTTNPANSLNVIANRLTNVNFGIYFSGVKSGGRISNNTVQLLFAPTGTVDAICVVNSQSVTVDNNSEQHRHHKHEHERDSCSE